MFETSIYCHPKDIGAEYMLYSTPHKGFEITFTYLSSVLTLELAHASDSYARIRARK